MAVDYNQIMAGIERQRQENEAEKRRQLEAQQAQMQAQQMQSAQPQQETMPTQGTDPNQQALQAAQYVKTAHPEYSQEQVAQDAQNLLATPEVGALPSLEKPQQADTAVQNQQVQTQPQNTSGADYASQAKSIGLAWSPEDADVATQYKNYLKRTTGQDGKIAEIREQMKDPNFASQAENALQGDTELNDLASRLNSYHAKKNGLNQTPEEAAYTTNILRMQIAQDPSLYNNAEAIMSGSYGTGATGGKSGGRRKGRGRRKSGKKGKNVEVVEDEEKLSSSALSDLLDEEESGKPKLSYTTPAEDAYINGLRNKGKTERYHGILGDADVNTFYADQLRNKNKTSVSRNASYLDSTKKGVSSDNLEDVDADDLNAIYTDALKRKGLRNTDVSFNGVLKNSKKKVNIESDPLSGNDVKKDNVVSGDSVLNTETDEEKLARYADPNKKLTKDEIKDAKQVVKRINAENWDKLHGDTGLNHAEALNKQVAAVINKTNPVTAFMSGLVERPTKAAYAVGNAVTSGLQKLPFLNKEQREGVGNVKNIINDNKASIQSELSGAHNQHPYIYGGGKVAENAAEYAAVNGALEGTKLAGTLAEKLGEHGANIALGTMADAALDTLPAEIGNASKGMNAKDIAVDATKNLAGNAAMNAGFEYLPVLGGAIKNKIFKKGASEAVQNGAHGVEKELVQNVADSGENAVKNALEGVEDVKPQNELPKLNASTVNTPEVPKEIPSVKQIVNESIDNAVNKDAVDNILKNTPEIEKNPKADNDVLKMLNNYQKQANDVRNGLSDADKAEFDKITDPIWEKMLRDNSRTEGASDMNAVLQDFKAKASEPTIQTRIGEMRASDISNRFENVAQNGLDYVAKKRVDPKPIESKMSESAYKEMMGRMMQLKGDIDDIAKKVDFSDKPQAAAKFEELKASYNFLDEAATSPDMAYITQAKKAVNSARANFCNAMKKAGDDSYKSIYGKRYGSFVDSIGKIASDSKNAVSNATDALKTDADGFVKTDEIKNPFGIEDSVNEKKVNDVLAGNGLRLSDLQAQADPMFDNISLNTGEVKNAIPNINGAEKTADAVKSTEIPKLSNQIPVDLQRFATMARKYETELSQIPDGEFKERLKTALTDFRSKLVSAVKNNDAGSAQKALKELDSVYNAGGRKVSQFYKNSLARGGGFASDEQFAKMSDVLSYESSTEKESVKQAEEFLEKFGDKVAKTKLLDKDDFSHTDVDSMMMLIRKQTAKLDELEKNGADLTEAQHDLHVLTKKLQDISSNNAQSMQALAKWSRNTPEGLLMQAEQIIKGKANISEDSALGKQMKKYFKDKDIEVSEAFEADFLKKAKEFEQVAAEKGVDSREAQKAMAEMGRLVNKEIPVKLPSKFTALLMDNMLGNFRTLITRNAGGNVGYNAMEQTVKTPIAAGIDKLLSLKTGRRTQAGLSLEGLKEYGSGFKRGIGDELGDIKGTFKNGGTHTARIGENTLENAIDANSRTFKNPILNAYDQSVKHGLSFGDRGFYDGAYKNELGNLYRLREKSLLGEELQKLSDEQFEEYAKKWASTKAKEAVYQDDTLISKGFSGIKKNLGEVSKGTIGADVLSQTSMPFVKTPANVLNRGIEYSPVGVVKNAIMTAKDIKNAKGLKGLNPAQQNRIANETARNLIGTGLFAAGAMLRKNGTVTGAYDDNKDAKAAQKRSGMQEYALDTSKIPALKGTPLDNKNYNYDWVSVIAPGIQSGAVAYDKFNTDDGKGTIDKLAESAGAGLQTQFDQSFFQGLQRLAGGSSTYNSDKGLAGNIGDTISSGVGQGVPSLMRQITQVSDPKQRYISGEGNYNVNSALSGVPVKRQKFEVNVDNEGNEMLNKQGRSTANRAWEYMIDPGTWTDVKSSKLDAEAMRLHESTGNSSAFIDTPSRGDLEKDGNMPTDKEFMQYKKDLGKASSSTAEKLIDSDGYKRMTDTDKESALNDVYTTMKMVQRHKRGLVDDKKYSGNKLAQAYEENGEKGVIDAILEKSETERLGISSNDNTKEIYAKEGTKGLEDYKKANDIYVKYAGATGNGKVKNLSKDAYEVFAEGGIPMLKKALLNDANGITIKKFATAKEAIPSLKYDSYVSTLQQIDSNGDGSLGYKEIASTVKGLSKSDGEKIIKAYYSNPDRFKYIDGAWRYTDKNGKVKLK